MFKPATWSMKDWIFWGWTAFSVVFIALVTKDFLVNQVYRLGMEQGANQALERAVGQMVAQAETCQPFPVFAGERQVLLQKVDCPAEQ